MFSSMPPLWAGNGVNAGIRCREGRTAGFLSTMRHEPNDICPEPDARNVFRRDLCRYVQSALHG